MSDLLDAIISGLDVYKKHGIKGCLIVVLVLLVIIGGVVIGSQVHAKDTMIVVASARYISGDAKILFQGRSLLLATLVGTALVASVCYLLRRK